MDDKRRMINDGWLVMDDLTRRMEALRIHLAQLEDDMGRGGAARPPHVNVITTSPYDDIPSKIERMQRKVQRLEDKMRQARLEEAEQAAASMLAPRSTPRPYNPFAFPK